ncbi:MAG: hypothetical protein ACREIA_08420 [Opitutaceae bacterium]
MINGVIHPGQLSPSIFTQTRSASAVARASASNGTSAPAESKPAEDGQDQKALLREFQVLGLAARQFSEILPRIESLDVPIE